VKRDAEMRDGIWTIDADGNTSYVNDAMASMLGMTVAEMIGKSSFDYVFPEDAATARKLFEGKSRGAMSPFEFRIRRKDGSPLWVTVQGTPMRDEAGQFRGIIGTFRAMQRDAAIKSPGVIADKKA
jgi:PAS domain S-box-containing protein